MKDNERKTAGIILAAGLASRMGRCKPLLPVPEVSALDTSILRMREAGVSDIIVVTGRYREAVAEEAGRLGAAAVHNADYESGMFSSVSSGVRALPPSAEAFFLLPVDTPLVKTFTYASLMEIFFADGGLDAVHPSFMGTRAHPPLLSWSIAGSILDWRGDDGLRGFLAEFPHRARDVRVADRGVALDMDTPEDYELLLSYAGREFCPDAEECGELLAMAGTPERVIRHGRVVEAVALAVADALTRGGVETDRAMLSSACLLHDIAKGDPEHEAAGARYLAARGYGHVASLVAAHKDLPEGSGVEAEILFLADKITDGEEVSSIDARAARMESRWPPGSEAALAACRRMERAGVAQRKFETAAGMPLSDMLNSGLKRV